MVGTSRLMMMFGAKDMQLKQWTVTDPQGYDTTVAVYNLDTSKRPDPNLFQIDYTQLPQLTFPARSTSPSSWPGSTPAITLEGAASVTIWTDVDGRDKPAMTLEISRHAP